MLHEEVVRAVVGEIIEGDKQAEGREAKSHRDFGVTGDQHWSPTLSPKPISVMPGLATF